MTYLLHFSIPLLLYQSHPLILYIITIFSLFFSFVSFSNFFLSKRDKKMMYFYMGSNEERSVKNAFVSIPFHMTDYVFIFIHCNINAIPTLIIMNNIRNKLVMIPTHYGNQQYQSLSVILIIIIRIDIASNY